MAAINTVMDTVDPPRKRRRPALSCVECRRRKIKCDRNKPCGPCLQSQSPTCTFSNDSSRKPTQSSSPNLFENPSTQSSRQEYSSRSGRSGELSNGHFPTPGPSPAASSNPSGTDPAQPWKSTTVQENETTGTAEALRRRIRELEGQLSANKNEGHLSSPQPEPIPHMGSQPIRFNTSKTRYFGPSHCSSYIEQVG